MLSRSMAAELAPDRIRVNCVAPVLGETGLLESFMGLPDTPHTRAKFIATIPRPPVAPRRHRQRLPLPRLR